MTANLPSDVAQEAAAAAERIRAAQLARGLGGWVAAPTGQPTSRSQNATNDDEPAAELPVRAAQVTTMLRELGMKDSRVAHLVGVSANSVNRWKDGRLNPTTASLTALRMLVAIRRMAPGLLCTLRHPDLNLYLADVRGLRTWLTADQSVPDIFTDGADLEDDA